MVLKKLYILGDSELLSEVNDAFCKSHPLLAQKVVTRSATIGYFYSHIYVKLDILPTLITLQTLSTLT